MVAMLNSRGGRIFVGFEEVQDGFKVKGKTI